MTSTTTDEIELKRVASPATTGVPQPLQQLCNIIKAIANTETSAKPVVDKAEATALALGIAKLMKFKQPALSRNGGQNDEDDDAAAGELVAKHLDSDFSCFLCRKKCRSRSRFFLHFKRHFNKAHRASKLDDGADEDEGSSSDSMDDENQEQIHLRGLKAYSNINYHHPRRRRPQHQPSAHQAKNQQNLKKRSSIADHDGDSGCHSAGGASSSNGEFTSDCPGDSESSDSDTEVKKSTPWRHPKPKSSAAAAAAAAVNKNKLSLAEKQLDNNETESLVCMTCLKRFSNCQNLRRHLRLHISRDSIKPDFEEDSHASHNSPSPIEDGVGIDSGMKAAARGRYLCDWCPARFDNRSAARIHESTHRGQEPKCYVCSKQYADRYSLRYHLRTHGIGRQIRCEFCSKAFSKPSRLASHVRSHHKNIRDFACPSCDKAFKTRVHLNNHFRQHSGEKPYECDVCHERFRHKASMISHCRKHDGQRPYCCEVCGKTFREPSTLKAHSRVHTGDKPYVCTDCGKSFTQRAGLNYHRRASHENIRPHACRLCPFATVKSASLTAHYRNIHQQQPSANMASTALNNNGGVEANMDVCLSSKNTPLPSFDDLKTSSAEATTFVTNSVSPAPALTPPSSASPVSSTSSTPCLEDFLPSLQQSSVANASSNDYHHQQSQQSHQHISMTTELATSHMDYNGYDYGYPHHQRQHPTSMYHHDQLMQQQSHAMHHSSHQQQSHQWFSYASGQHHHPQQHHQQHQMLHANANAANNNPATPPSASPSSSSPPSNYSYAGYHYFSAASANANGNASTATPEAPGSYHHFTPGSSYEAYSSGSNGGEGNGGNGANSAGGGTHPSYCI